ncbi:hypothetical protein FGO68_gene6325 [Halteria grandinella]|uniref:Uncharacterized protein n=1 Tax=Halteria grandinella TaxID=5974 RepID=A0A8J8P2F1_HALGN|nr:hypothetical protein FGO68_gene6325 [Halteria grandinella]
MQKQLATRSFSLYLKNRGTFTYESVALKIRDKQLDFPHGKRNKIVLCARELDYMMEYKIKERETQQEVLKSIGEVKGKYQAGQTMSEHDQKILNELESKREILSANSLVLLYRSMLQMTQKLALFEMGDMVIEDIPRNHNFLVLHSLLKHHAKLEEIDQATLGCLASFPMNPNVLYDLETIKFEEFDAVTNGTDLYWMNLIDKLEGYFKKCGRL